MRIVIVFKFNAFQNILNPQMQIDQNAYAWEHFGIFVVTE